MNIIVDTSVWSLAFRKKDLTKEETKIVEDLSELVKDLRVVMIGPIRQEILSGISNVTKFEELKERLSVFIDLPIKIPDYELAAQYYNKCRKHGVQGSHIDFLICSVASNGSYPIFTLDNDFRNYKKHIPIELYIWNK